MASSLFHLQETRVAVFSIALGLEFILCLADSIPFGNNLTTRSCCTEEQRASIKQALDDRDDAARVIFIAHGVVYSWDFSTTKKEEELASPAPGTVIYEALRNIWRGKIKREIVLFLFYNDLARIMSQTLPVRWRCSYCNNFLKTEFFLKY